MKGDPVIVPGSRFSSRRCVNERRVSTCLSRYIFFQQEGIQRGEWEKCDFFVAESFLPARGRVGLEVHRCLCIVYSGNVFIPTRFFAVGAGSIGIIETCVGAAA
jgi:hypothetical protein